RGDADLDSVSAHRYGVRGSRFRTSVAREMDWAREVAAPARGHRIEAHAAEAPAHSPRPMRIAAVETARVMPRLACLYVPMFPLAARLRSEPDLRDTAL